MKIVKHDKRILKTVIATVVLLAAFFVQGAVVVMGGIVGTKSALIRGVIIWTLVILTLCYYGIRYKGFSRLGFVRMEKGAAKRLLYFAPLLVIAFSHFTAGFDMSEGIKFAMANVIFTLSIGMAEEIYFRGIICNIWLDEGSVKAMLVSAILFALCHLLNMAGGASVTATILQICFAFIYGLVFALIFTAGKSIVPCVLLHSLHDFCSFISADGSLNFNILLGSIQVVILIFYLIYLVNTVVRKDKTNESI